MCNHPSIHHRTRAQIAPKGPRHVRWFDDKCPHSRVNQMRRRRFRRFRVLLESLSPPVTILDVGGTEDFWRMMDCLPGPDIRITLLNRMMRPVANTEFECVVGDGCAMTMFSDHQFDLVMCNSVIEHVGDWERQVQMAGEVRRVGRRYFVQTPNRHFPIEAHTRLPWFQFWPRRWQVQGLTHRNLGVFPRQPDRARAEAYLKAVRLVSGREMRRLFPDAVVCRERFLGLTKSWMAIGPADGFTHQPF